VSVLSQTGLRTTALRDNVRVFTLGGESIATSYGANCTAVAGRESVLLVDPLPDGTELLQKLRAAFPGFLLEEVVSGAR